MGERWGRGGHTYIHKEEFTSDREVREVLELLASLLGLHDLLEIHDGPVQRRREVVECAVFVRKDTHAEGVQEHRVAVLD